MKRKLIDNCFLALVVIFTALTSGCLTTKQPVVSQAPVVTRTPVVSQTVNPATGQVATVTNLVSVTNFVPVTNFVYSPNTQAIASVVGTLSALNAATAPLDPYSPLVSTVLPWGAALIGTLATGFAAYQNNRKKGVISALVTGIETAAGGGTDTTPITLQTVKASVKNQSVLNGTAPDVQAAVQKLT